MTHGHGTADAGFDPKHNKAIAVSGVVGMVLVILTFVVGDQYFRRVAHDKIQEIYLGAENPELIDLRTRETILLESYDWVDRDQGVVRIPIDRAMELTAQEAGG